MDEPIPIRRAVIGFVLIVAFVLLVMLAVRPAIFVFAPPRDDTSVVAGTLTEVTGRHQRVEVVLSRSYGWDGERDADDGLVQLGIIVGPTPTGIAAVNGASPVVDDCEVAIGEDRLTDCDGRTWTFAGLPIDPDDPPLQRFPIRAESGTVFVDLSRLIQP